VLGIDVRIQQKEWNVLRRDLEKGMFDVFAGYEASYYSDPLEMMEKFERLNPSNFSQWENSRYQSLLLSARQRDPEKAQFPHYEDFCKILGKGEEIMLRELPLIPVCSDRFLFAHRKKLKGYAFDSVGSVDLSYASFTKK
jgi:ABC-type oligopeptide transport system substrate-binding subunit